MRALLIPAGNASAWTGPTGNNTWLIRGRAPALIDAGAGLPQHVEAVAAALGEAPLARVLITHGHTDHVAGIPALLARWPSALVIGRSTAASGRDPLADGACIPAGDGWLRLIDTPGHAPDHVCFVDEECGDVFCGDLVRLDGTVVIPASKGGNLREYLASLERVLALRPRRLLPGHGPVIDDPEALIRVYIAHRADRDRQILDAIVAGATTPDEIVARVYVDLPAALRSAAADTVTAHLVKLREDGVL